MRDLRIVLSPYRWQAQIDDLIVPFWAYQLGSEICHTAAEYEARVKSFQAIAFSSSVPKRSGTGVSCPPVSGDQVLRVHGDSVTLGASFTFSCPDGYYLAGASKITCLPSGDWSGSAGQCQLVRCPVLAPDDPHLQLQVANTTYTGAAVFTCVPGYRLLGHTILTCTANGTWSHPVPTCQEVVCQGVSWPEHGQVVGGGSSRRVGEALTFTCSPGYVVRGHPLSFCTSDGTWSHPPPTCVESCPHPGEPQHGRVSPRRPRYPIGATLLVTCHPGYRPAGPDRLTCLHTHRWSAPLTRCVPAIG
nr:locomotion-related protein Hikaru genki-like [Cherax quadricarinatus]